MTNLLIIETSARSFSISTALAHEFSEKLALNTVELNLKTRNLNSDQLQNLDEEMTIALRAGVKNPTELQAKTIAQSDAMIGEFDAADIILIAAPMHNFTISAQLRTYIDYITRPGKTFGYTEAGPKGLLVDRPVYIISTRGGQYGDGAPDKATLTISSLVIFATSLVSSASHRLKSLPLMGWIWEINLRLKVLLRPAQRLMLLLKPK